MKNISVIGGGTMGNGIAHVFAMKDYQVNLIDVRQEALDKALATIGKNLDRMVAKERISEQDKAQALSNIKTYTSLKEGVETADLVIEAATENESLKLKIFADMDEHAPSGAILATNTSSISITKLAAATQRPNKVIGMHFMNPVPIMKLVEVIAAYQTDKSVTDDIMELSTAIGKSPTLGK